MRPLLFAFLILPLLTTAQNQNISGGIAFEGEPFLAINPDNTQHLVVAWMGLVFGSPISIKSKVSLDGGRTWSQTMVLPHFGDGYQSADPSIEFDGDGNVYFCYIDYRKEPVTEGAVYLAKSRDGGLTVSEVHPVIRADYDPEKLPVDRP